MNDENKAKEPSNRFSSGKSLPLPDEMGKETISRLGLSRRVGKTHSPKSATDSTKLDQPHQIKVASAEEFSSLPDHEASSDIGVVLQRLKKQIEIGFGGSNSGVKVHDALDGALPEKMTESFQKNVLIENQRVQYSQILKTILESRYPNIEGHRNSRKYEVYNSILAEYQKLYADKAVVKLVIHNEELLVVAEHSCGERLRITEIFEPTFRETKAYQEYMEDSENLLNNIHFTGRTYESFVIVKHLLLEDTKTGKTVDVRSLLPDDWQLRLNYTAPDETAGFSQDFNLGEVEYGNLLRPELVVALLHELGHCYFTYFDDPEKAARANELWIRSRAHIGGTSAMQIDQLNETKTLLVNNERGASAYALMLVRMLKQEGVDLGASAETILKLLNTVLGNYERGYPGGKKAFTRKLT